MVISLASKEKNLRRQLENFHAAELRAVLPPAHQQGSQSRQSLGSEELSAGLEGSLFLPFPCPRGEATILSGFEETVSLPHQAQSLACLEVLTCEF